MDETIFYALKAEAMIRQGGAGRSRYHVSVTVGFIGEVYPGSGTAIAMIVVTGRIAGENAARE